MIDLGDVYRISIVCRDLDGTLASPGTATLTVTLPDGSTQNVATTIGAAGAVHGDFATTLVGRHSFVLSTTAPVTAHRDVFDVRTFDTTSLMSLADARAHLNLVSTSDDEEVRNFVAAASRIVESYVGATVVRSYTETLEGPAMLMYSPVIEVESIAALYGSTAVTADDIEADDAGRLVRTDNGSQLWGTYRVTYRAGRTDIPANWVRAVGIILQHMWQTQRGVDPRRAPMATTDEYQPQDAAGRHFSIPRRAVELLEPDMKTGIS